MFCCCWDPPRPEATEADGAAKGAELDTTAADAAIEGGAEFRKQGSGTIRVLRTPADQAGFLKELATGKRLLHLRGFSEGYQQLEQQNAEVAAEQKQQAIDAMIAFNPDYFVVDGEVFGSGFQYYAKACLETTKTFMVPASLIWLASAADGRTRRAESWADQGFAVTVWLLPEDQISARLDRTFGASASAALRPLDATARGGLKLFEDSASAPSWFRSLQMTLKAELQDVERRSSAQYFQKSSFEAAARSGTAMDLVRGAQGAFDSTAGLQGVMCIGGGESTLLELGAIFMNGESGIRESEVAIHTFKPAVGEPTVLLPSVGTSFCVEDMGDWMRQISTGTAHSYRPSAAEIKVRMASVGEDDEAEAADEEAENGCGESAPLASSSALPGVTSKKGSTLAVITQNWRRAVVGDGSTATALMKTPLLLGSDGMVDVLNALSKGLGDYLKADLEKVRKSKAPELKDGDDYKQWLIGEMPVHAATRYRGYVDDSAFMGQLWVGRQLEFWVEVFAGLKAGKGTKEAADAAYKGTLKKHHGMMQVAAFTGALKGLPDRKALMAALQGEAEESDLAADLEDFVSLGRPIAKYMLVLDKEIDGLRAQEQKNFGKKK